MQEVTQEWNASDDYREHAGERFGLKPAMFALLRLHAGALSKACTVLAHRPQLAAEIF